MTSQKLYAGVKLKAIRTKRSLTQKAFAAKLGVSLPYLNQMENNNRPISTVVLLALAAEFDVDITELQSGDEARLVSDMREALADPLFDPIPPLADLRLAATNAPDLAHAFLSLHDAYRRAQERLAALDETLGREEARLAPSPWEEVRDFFHYCDNYIDAVDRAAESLAQGGSSPASRAAAEIEARGITIAQTGERLRRFDSAARRLELSASAPQATRDFQLLHQHALLTRGDLLDATLDLARFRSDEARAIARIGLANYYAGAAMMPYSAFHAAARDMRHDLEQLAARFGASLEQVAHRLSTLQRPGAKGIPFFFVRVDPAGNITKRHSATSLQFARYGGACPLWNVHRAFETPGQWLRQIAETPDGMRYFCLARDVSKSGGRFGAPTRRFAIGLGCEMRHADAVIYADDLPNARAEPIGVSCRICERDACHQRAVPPLARRLQVIPNERGALPYRIG